MKAFKEITFALVYFSFTINCNAQKYVGELAPTEFGCSAEKLGFMANMFETKQQTVDFLEIKSGEVVTEVGAGDGVNMGIFSLLYDHVTFYAEDIDKKTLTEKSLGKYITYFNNIKKTPQTNTFKIVIGNETASNLPDSLFDNVLIINTLHDITSQDVMLNDVSKKLKPSGKLIVLDGFSFPGDTQTCRDYGVHVLNTFDVQIKRLENHGFYVTKMRSPDFNAAHYGNAVMLERDKKKSDEFYKKKHAIDPLVTASFRFKQKAIAYDTVVMKQITDSLINNINEITDVYKEYELWIKDVALRHMRRLDYKAAINILIADTRLYPSSYQTFYWLGKAYMENKQYSLALQNFKISLTLNPTNELCIKNIKAIKKRL